jgi:hypothetical protein
MRPIATSIRLRQASDLGTRGDSGDFVGPGMEPLLELHVLPQEHDLVVSDRQDPAWNRARPGEGSSMRWEMVTDMNMMIAPRARGRARGTPWLAPWSAHGTDQADHERDDGGPGQI